MKTGDILWVTSFPDSVLGVAAISSANLMQMKLMINGEEKQFAGATLEDLVETLALKGDRVAVELNCDIVPRTKWVETNLADGDKLEIVHFVGGGSSR